MHLLWIDSVQGDDCLSKLLCIAHLNLLLRLLDPAVNWLNSLADKEGLGVKNAIEIQFEVLPKQWRNLVQAASKSVAVAWGRSGCRQWREGACTALISEKSIDSAGDSVQDCWVFNCTDSQVENVALYFTVLCYLVFFRKLDAFNALDMVQLVKRTGADCSV